MCLSEEIDQDLERHATEERSRFDLRCSQTAARQFHAHPNTHTRQRTNECTSTRAHIKQAHRCIWTRTYTRRPTICKTIHKHTHTHNNTIRHTDTNELNARTGITHSVQRWCHRSLSWFLRHHRLHTRTHTCTHHMVIARSTNTHGALPDHRRVKTLKQGAETNERRVKACGRLMPFCKSKMEASVAIRHVHVTHSHVCTHGPTRLCCVWGYYNIIVSARACAVLFVE